jgi:hypothetical protein
MNFSENSSKAGEFRNWLPTRLIRGPVECRIRWTYFGRDGLAEPFFNQSVRRVQKRLGAKPRFTGPDVLLRMEEEVSPSGFIFHISRCGSTLLGNALRTAPGTVVISEAQPIGACFDPSLSPEDSGQMGLRGLLNGLFRAFGQRRYGDERALTIKFTSWNILRLALIRELWPDVPCLLLIRDPVEVVVSCLQKPPGWMLFKRNPLLGSRIFGWSPDSIRGMTDEEFCARVVGAYLQVAAANASSTCRVIDYSDINATSVPHIMLYLRITPAQIRDDQLAITLKTYSKDVQGSRAFEDDRDKKQAAASEAIQLACKKWAQDPYRDLLSRLARTNWQ